MGFLLCGRFRKLRRFTSPSECSPSPSFMPAESSPLRHDCQQGMTPSGCILNIPDSDTSIGPSSTEHSQPPIQNEHSSHSSSGWPGKLRRRLSSRDSKRLHLIPKRTDRSTEISLLSLSRNLDVLADPVAADDVGSSLMSERGYDSDAQGISTPAHTAPITDRPPTAASLERAISSLEKPYQGAGTGYTSGQPQELRPEDERREISDTRSALARPAYVRHIPQQLHCSTDIAKGAAHRVPSPLANVTNLSIHDKEADTSRPLSISEQSAKSATTDHGVLSLPTSINGGRGRFYATVAQHGLQAAQASYERSSESLAGKNSEIAVAKRHHRGSSAEARSIHLGDMNISKALASTSTSPRILSQNPSVDENGQNNGYSIRSLSDHYHDCVVQRSANTPSLGQNGLNGFDFGLAHKRDASSFYSPKSSISSAGIPASYRYSSLTANTSSLLGSERGPSGGGYEYAPAAQPYTDMSVVIDSNAAGSESGAQTDALTSKFVEQFGISPPVGSPRSVSNEALPPRKISVGWMSGGRRVGYGYSLVAKDETENQKTPADSSPPEDSGNNGMANGGTDEENTENQDQDSDRQASMVLSALDEPSVSNNDLPNSVNPQALRRWSGATALVRATDSSESTNRSSTASSFWEWFTSRRINQDETGEKVSGKVGSDQGQSQDVEEGPKNSPVFRNRYSELFDEGSRMRFTLGSNANQCSATNDSNESVMQTPSNMSRFGSLPTKRPRVRFRVLNRSKKRDTSSSADFPSVFPVKRSLWRRNSETLGVHGRLVDPGPGRYRPKHSKRFSPDGAEDDHESLEMHSNPE